MSELILGGPMFQPAEDAKRVSIFGKEGSHYNIFKDKDPMGLLRNVFPDGMANELNFVLFSTSGVHGSYVTIEDAEKHLRGKRQKDWAPEEVTFLLVMPRIVSMTYGNVPVQSKTDAKFLKKLRASSWAAVRTIGAR